MKRALRALFAAAATGGMAAALAATPTVAGASSTTVTWSLDSSEVVGAGWFHFHYQVTGAPFGSQVQLQRREAAPQQPWGYDEPLSAGNQSGTAQSPGMGAYLYRIVVLSGGSPVAISKKLPLHVYGRVPFVRMCRLGAEHTNSSCGRGSIDIAARPFVYSANGSTTCKPTACHVAFQFPKTTTCRSGSFQVGATDTAPGSPGGVTASIGVTQPTRPLQSLSIPIDTSIWKPFRFNLDNGAFKIDTWFNDHASSGQPADLYLRGTLICYTFSGEQ